jgi:hypothetical protein
MKIIVEDSDTLSKAFGMDNEEKITEQITADILKECGEDPILYIKIENAIINWSNDETKTAGELTRSILKLIK